MRHARSDYDSIQPWPTKRPHIGRQNGVVVNVNPEPGSWSEIDAEVQVKNGNIGPIIPDDEPVFLIRGQDRAAIPAAEAWCEAATELGADAEIIATVRRHIEVVREWQETHAKVPDAPADVLR